MSDTDRRADSRQRVCFSGSIGSPCLTEPVGAQIRSISAAGAGIRLVCQTVLPKELTLTLVDRKMVRNARIVWRRGLDAGLEFAA
jgi:hypothetical protein